MEDLTFEQASWLGRFEREAGEGTSFSALESFEGFAANVRRLVSEHAASPLALVGEVFESDDEERLFFRRWKNFLDAGIGTIARSFVIDDIIFAGQIAASMRLVGLLRRITAEWAHLSPEHRHQLGTDFRENAQALSDAYGTASSADFILMKDRFADRLKGEFEGFLEAADHPVDETDRDAVIFRAASERFSKGVIATVKSVVTQVSAAAPRPCAPSGSRSTQAACSSSSRAATRRQNTAAARFFRGSSDSSSRSDLIPDRTMRRPQGHAVLRTFVHLPFPDSGLSPRWARGR